MQIPIEWGNLTEKKLQHVRLAGNPLADPRIRRFVETDAPSMVKDLLNHLRKNGYRGDEGGGPWTRAARLPHGCLPLRGEG